MIRDPPGSTLNTANPRRTEPFGSRTRTPSAPAKLSGFVRVAGFLCYSAGAFDAARVAVALVEDDPGQAVKGSVAVADERR